jgi:hypothetical protein
MKMINNVISVDEVEADLIHIALQLYAVSKLRDMRECPQAHLTALKEITPKFKALRDKLLETSERSDFDVDIQDEGW